MFGNLSVNQVLRNTVSEKEYRILYISDDRKTGFWIELDPNGGMPDQCDIEEIDALLMAGEMTQVKDTWLPPRTASEKSRNQRDVLWQHLRECLEREPAIFEKNNRKALLEKASGDCGIAVPNLYPKLKRFWRYGKVKDAFLYADENKGGKGKTRLLKKNSGRKPTESAICSKVLTEDDLGLFEKYVMKHYLNRQENLTLKEVWKFYPSVTTPSAFSCPSVLIILLPPILKFLIPPGAGPDQVMVDSTGPGRQGLPAHPRGGGLAKTPKFHNI